MKKLNHPNLVALYEVLDDPAEDSLYMVMEMCKKGVVMHIGIDDRAEPYGEEQCRHFFRDLILGIEYREAFNVLFFPILLLEPADHLLRAGSSCAGRSPSRHQTGQLPRNS